MTTGSSIGSLQSLGLDRKSQPHGVVVERGVLVVKYLLCLTAHCAKEFLVPYYR